MNIGQTDGGPKQPTASTASDGGVDVKTGATSAEQDFDSRGREVGVIKPGCMADVFRWPALAWNIHIGMLASL